MEKLYLKLSNGRIVRIVHSDQVIQNFISSIGKSMEFYISGLLRGDYMFIESSTLAWLMAIEGEKSEGKELLLTEKEFKRLVRISEVTEFLKLLSKMNLSSN
jgi:hypothetical protein